MTGEAPAVPSASRYVETYLGVAVEQFFPLPIQRGASKGSTFGRLRCLTLSLKNNDFVMTQTFHRRHVLEKDDHFRS